MVQNGRLGGTRSETHVGRWLRTGKSYLLRPLTRAKTTAMVGEGLSEWLG